MNEPQPLWQLSDEQLFACLTTGNEDALALLLLRLQAPLQKMLATKIGARLAQSVSVEDILQETYQAVFTNFGRFEGHELGAFTGWVTKIAENCVHSAGRHAAAQKRGGGFQRAELARDDLSRGTLALVDELSTGDATASQFAAKEEAIEAMRIAIASLPADQQAVVRHRYFEQLTIEQTAETMDRSPGSIRGLLDRARAALRVSMHNSALWFSR